MKCRFTFHLFCGLLIIALLSACTPAPREMEYPQSDFERKVVETVVVEKGEAYLAEATAYPAMPMATPMAFLPGSVAPVGGDLLRPMVIKNAELRLLVEDTTVASDRLTQVVEDLGGYIISSRRWVQEMYGENYQYASYTLGVPVDEFETALRRLRGLAIEVLDEVASGQDVSEEYVDLQSRLENLESTRQRIREFLEQAQDVEEALKVNDELTRIEEEIELIRGRMQYLAKRAAISTITVYLEPQTTPVTPTPTPAAWDPGDTINRASHTLTLILRRVVDAAIWLGVVVVPLIGVPVLIFYGMVRLSRRLRKKNISETPEN